MPPRMTKVELYAAIRRDSKAMPGRELQRKYTSQPSRTGSVADQASRSGIGARS
jgi:hypothetical protein